MTRFVSADTDDLDAFVEHGESLERPLVGTFETLARQRNHLLGIGLRHVVVGSELATLDNTLGFMVDLDRFVGDISAALKRLGADRGDGLLRAAVDRIQPELDRSDAERLDHLERALEAEGLGRDQARRLRDEVGRLVEIDPRFEVDGATLSEPGGLAAALVVNIEDRARELLNVSRAPFSTLHARPALSVDRLAAELAFGDGSERLVPADLLDEQLRSVLTEEQYRELQHELVELDRRHRLANRSLIEGSPGRAELDVDIEGLVADAGTLYEANQVGLPYGGDGHRLDEPGIAYQLQKVAEDDPARALGLKWLLDGMLMPHERAELDRVLATNGTFSERIGLAVANPRDGLVGAGKGLWNDNAGWLIDGWADAQVAITNGFYGLATNPGPRRSADLDRALHEPPSTWEENEAIIELEFTMDNLAEQGGADLAVAVELASAAYGGGRGGLSLVRVGRRSGLRYRPLGRGSTVNNVDRFHPRSLREQLAIDEVMQNPDVGQRASDAMGDSRWPHAEGWRKRQQTVYPGGGEGPVTVHYNYNPRTGEVDDFKIVGRRGHVPPPEPNVSRGR